MPTFNQGIRTNAGYNLFGRVQSGQTKIHYTKVVFSSLDLSNKTNDDIQNMTDVNPKELIIPNPQVLYKPRTNNSDQETEIRAIGSNEILKKGFYINTYALFAADDSGNEILYGVTADNNPSWLPAYDGVRPQALTYNWDTGDNDTNNVHFTDSHDAYATYGDYQDFSQNIKDQLQSDQSVHDIPSGTDLSQLPQGKYTGIWQNSNTFKGFPDITFTHDQSFNLIVVDDNGNDRTQIMFLPQGIYYRNWWKINASGTPSQWIKLASNDDLSNIKDNVNQSISQVSSKLQSDQSVHDIPSGTDLSQLPQGKYTGVWQNSNTFKGFPDITFNHEQSFNLIVVDDNGDDRTQIMFLPNGVYYRNWWKANATNTQSQWIKLASNDDLLGTISRLTTVIKNSFNQANSYTDSQINKKSTHISRKELWPGANLNTISLGRYVCDNNSNVKSLQNCPVNIGFILDVESDYSGDMIETLKCIDGIFYRAWWGNDVKPWNKL